MKAILRTIPAEDESFKAEMLRMLCALSLALYDTLRSPLRILLYLIKQIRFSRYVQWQRVRGFSLNWGPWEWGLFVVLGLFVAGVAVGWHQASDFGDWRLLISTLCTWGIPVFVFSGLYWTHYAYLDHTHEIRERSPIAEWLMEVLAVLSWPRFGRRDITISTMFVSEVALGAYGLIQAMNHGGLWWLLPAGMVAIYIFTGCMVTVIAIVDLLSP